MLEVGLPPINPINRITAIRHKKTPINAARTNSRRTNDVTLSRDISPEYPSPEKIFFLYVGQLNRLSSSTVLGMVGRVRLCGYIVRNKDVNKGNQQKQVGRNGNEA